MLHTEKNNVTDLMGINVILVLPYCQQKKGMSSRVHVLKQSVFWDVIETQIFQNVTEEFY